MVSVTPAYLVWTMCAARNPVEPSAAVSYRRVSTAHAPLFSARASNAVTTDMADHAGSVPPMESVSLVSVARLRAKVFAVNLMRSAISVSVAAQAAWTISAVTMAAEEYVASVPLARDALAADVARIRARKSVARQTRAAGRANVVNPSATD